MRNFFLFIFAIATFNIQAQQKHLTIDDSVLGYYKGLYPQSLQMLQWIEGTDQYIYMENNVFHIKSADGKISKDLTLSEINKTYSNLKRLPSFEKINANHMVFQTETEYTIYDYNNKNEVIAVKMEDGADHFDFNYENYMLAYTIDNNLYVGNAQNSKMAVTNNSDANIVSGQSIHRNEFGISKGTFWSPKGNFLAFYQKNETHVTNYPLVDETTYPATLKSIKYPMAGQGSELAKVGIYNVKTQSLVYLDIDTSDEHYLTNLGWSPDEKYLTLAEENRAQNHYSFNVYDVATGKKVRTVFEESNDRWVEPEFPALFFPNSNTTFLWMSEKDGFMNVYQYDLLSNATKQITKFKFVVTQILGFDPKCEHIFVEATGTDPKGLQIFKVNLLKDKVTALTPEAGTHQGQLSQSTQYILDVFSNLKTPGKTFLLDTKTLKSTTLLESSNPLKDYQLGTTEFVKLKAVDGQDLEAVITKPAQFDPNKKYPVLIYVYGGPHAQLVTDNWMGGTGLWMQYLAAEEDYIVFTLDNRGSSNRGFEFESVIHRNQGVAAMSDQMIGVAYLKSLPYVDSERLSVYGWSYGGFMTISLLLNYPDVFKAGVAGGPVTDWKYYEVMYGERYMDTPQENPNGYESTRLHNKIKNLKSKLLIIHGSNDDTVVPQHSMTLLKEAVEKNIPIDFFTYPMHAHNVRGRDRIHLNTKIIDYILKNNLK
jgi:dipeptidyl-peptidase 4